MKRLVLVLVALISGFGIGCKTTDTGTVNVVTNKGAIEAIKRPEDGFYTTLSPYADAYEVDLRTFTEETKDVKVQSKDNTGIVLGTLQITAHTDGNLDSVREYVTKFGFDEKIRHDKRLRILDSQLQTEARKAFSQYDAYQVYANQNLIQQALFEAMKKICAEELFLIAESVQFGNWHFDNPSIEQAASAVVANRKNKEAEEAALAAAQVNQQRRAIEAQVFQNPQLFKLEELKYTLWIEQARSQGISNHQGSLFLNYAGGGPQVQVQAGGSNK